MSINQLDGLSEIVRQAQLIQREMAPLVKNIKLPDVRKTQKIALETKGDFEGTRGPLRKVYAMSPGVLNDLPEDVPADESNEQDAKEDVISPIERQLITINQIAKSIESIAKSQMKQYNLLEKESADRVNGDRRSLIVSIIAVVVSGVCAVIGIFF